jgi:hypothetical protein
VTLGNVVGGGLFTGMALHVTHRKRAVAAPEAALPGALQREMAAEH